MKVITRVMTSAVFLVISLTSLTAAAEQKIAIVDVQRILQSLPQLATIEQTINSEFADRRQEVQKLQSDGNFMVQKLQRESATMSEEEKTQLQQQIQQVGEELQSKAQPLQQEIQIRTNQERDKLLSLIEQAIDAIAAEKDFDLVFNAAVVPFSKPNHDISQDVLDQVSKVQL
ncbi:MAG: OmpH family outer membrane protein [Pseudomonadota bacterium]